MSAHVYEWRAMTEPDPATGEPRETGVHAARGPEGLWCMVEVVPDRFVAWSVRVGDAQGEALVGGEAPIESYGDQLAVVSYQKRLAQQHADLLAPAMRWHRERLEAETARLREEVASGGYRLTAALIERDGALAREAALVEALKYVRGRRRRVSFDVWDAADTALAAHEKAKVTRG